MPKDKQQANNAKDLTVIGKASSITGDLKSDGTVDIIGEFIGNSTLYTVNIREGANYKGIISANSVTIAGNFEGDIVTEQLVINKTAVISGNINYKSIFVEAGAILNCKIVHNS